MSGLGARAGDGPRRDCRHTHTRHVHGTQAAYVHDRCRCRDCRDAAARYNARASRLAAYGRWRPFVDAAPAREHVRLLRDAGLGLARIARLAGVPYSTLSRLVHGGPRGKSPSRRVRPATEQRILAVSPDLAMLGSAAVVDATGTRRRLQALVWLGYSQARLAAELGMHRHNVSKVLGRDRVHAATARDVRAAYDRLGNAPPAADTPGQRKSVTRAHGLARARGWAPPLAWDNIDDPDEAPKG